MMKRLLQKKGKKRKKKAATDDGGDALLLDEALPEIEIEIPKPRSKKKSNEPRIVRMPVTMPSLLKETPVKTTKAKAEPKGKFVLEYVVKCSPALLFEFLTTPSGLSEWFADDVNIRNDIFTFFWDGSSQDAEMVGYREGKLLRLRWLDKPEEYYFEWRIESDELTGDTSLIITDFGDNDEDIKTSKLLWDSQVNKLLQVLGSY